MVKSFWENPNAPSPRIAELELSIWQRLPLSSVCNITAIRLHKDVCARDLLVHDVSLHCIWKLFLLLVQIISLLL